MCGLDEAKELVEEDCIYRYIDIVVSDDRVKYDETKGIGGSQRSVSGQDEAKELVEEDCIYRYTDFLRSWYLFNTLMERGVR